MAPCGGLGRRSAAEATRRPDVSTGRRRRRRRPPDETREQLPAAAHLVVAVQVLDVDVHGVPADAHPKGDLLLAVAGEDALQRLADARGQGATAGGGLGAELLADEPAELRD